MVTDKDIEQIASVARLKLSDEEQQSFSEQLNGLIEYLAKLEQVDLSSLGEKESYTEYRKRPFREDVVIPSLPREQLLLNAPDEEDGFFKVPSVLE